MGRVVQGVTADTDWRLYEPNNRRVQRTASRSSPLQNSGTTRSVLKCWITYARRELLLASIFNTNRLLMHDCILLKAIQMCTSW